MLIFGITEGETNPILCDECNNPILKGESVTFGFDTSKPDVLVTYKGHYQCWHKKWQMKDG